jgi:tetratricopeptide (TPR) repeat protein
MSDGDGFIQKGKNIHDTQTNIQEANATVISGKVKTVNIYSDRPEKPLIPHQIPLPPIDLTGRENDLRDLMSFYERGSSIIALRGMGGVGKSALAFALAQKLKDRFPDGHLFISMMGTSPKPLTPAEAMVQAIRSYKPALRLPESEAELANLYRSVLDGKRALFLLDNALDDRQVRPLLPVPEGCCLIITSRRKFSLPGMSLKDLDVLKLDAAADLLLKTAGEDFPVMPVQYEDEWKGLARLCGCLPVALKAAGGYLANIPGSSPKKYIKELQDERMRLAIIGKEGVDEDEDLATKLNLSYGRLAPDTALVFRLISIFPSDFGAESEEAVCQDEGHRHLIDLVRWSLVEYERHGEEDEGRYHLHDLVRIYASSQLELDGEAAIAQAHILHSAHYLTVLQKANGLMLEGGESLTLGLKLFDSEWSNIQAGQAWASSQSTVNPECSEICSNYAWQGNILDLRLHPVENVRWLEAALACARQSGNKEAEGAHLGNLGIAYKNLGDARKAIDYYEQHLTIAREIGDRRGEGADLGNLGNAYASLGKMDTAIDCAKSALAIFEEIESPYAKTVRGWLTEWKGDDQSR